MAKPIKMKSKIVASSAEGAAVYSNGAGVIFVGIPKGMVGNSLTFLGSFDGFAFFPVLDYSGQPVRISTRIPQPAPDPDVFSDASAAIFPIAQPALFRGMQMIRPVSSSLENSESSIEFYFEQGPQ
jgi:hypothetical protein